MNIEMSPREKSLVMDILRRELTELPSEIRRTRTSSYRDELKERQRILRGIHERLRQTSSGMTPHLV